MSKSLSLGMKRTLAILKDLPSKAPSEIATFNCSKYNGESPGPNTSGWNEGAVQENVVLASLRNRWLKAADEGHIFVRVWNGGPIIGKGLDGPGTDGQQTISQLRNLSTSESGSGDGLSPRAER